MAEQPLDGLAGDDGEPDAQVVPFKRDTSYEHPLDEPDDDSAEPVHEGAGIALPAIRGERRAIIPAHYRTWNAARAHLGKRAADIAHPAGFHGVRLFWYLLLGTWWAVTAARALRPARAPAHLHAEHNDAAGAGDQRGRDPARVLRR